MNKKEYISKLMEVTGYDENKCTIINSVLEDHFIIGKRNREKIINDFMEKLDVDSKTADDIYNKSIGVLSSGIKNKLKHPFKSRD